MSFNAKDYMINNEFRASYKTRKNYSKQRAQVIKMYADPTSGGAATLERPITPETEFEGTKPPGGGNSIGGGDGGDGGDGGVNDDSDDKGPNLKSMGVEEKFGLQGIFANYAMS